MQRGVRIRGSIGHSRTLIAGDGGHSSRQQIDFDGNLVSVDHCCAESWFFGGLSRREDQNRSRVLSNDGDPHSLRVPARDRRREGFGNVFGLTVL
jgi:hypothetical protein